MSEPASVTSFDCRYGLVGFAGDESRRGAVRYVGPDPIQDHRRAAEQRDEVAALHHSITSSARKSKDSEIVNPNALAVLRLMTSSNLTGRWIGKSAGPVPLIIWSAKPAKRR